MYYEPKGASAADLRLMALIDNQFLDTLWYRSRQMARHMPRNDHKCLRHRVRRLIRLMRWFQSIRSPIPAKSTPSINMALSAEERSD